MGIRHIQDMRADRTAGFTLPEILVAIALSGVVITALLGVFFSFIEYQASSQDQRDALESVRFVLSDVSREMSFGRDYRCGLTLGGDCVCVTFLDQLQRTTKVRYNSTAKRIEKSVQLLDRDPAVCAQVGDVNDQNTWAPLTDNSVNITQLKFELETALNKQPRARIFISAEYDFEGDIETVSVKTQVTKRILEPKGRALLESFRIGTDARNTAGRAYFFYGACDRISSTPAPECPAGKSSGDLVCQNERNVVQMDSLCERVGYKPVSAEFSKKGMFILMDNLGFVFFMPNAQIDSALSIIGGSSPVSVKVGDIVNSVSRVLGVNNTRGGDNDPQGIISIYSGKDTVLAQKHDGALYQLGFPLSHASNATRIFSGAVARNRVSHIGTDDDNKTFLSFIASNGERRLQLHSGATTIHNKVGPGDCNSNEFTYVGTSRNCGRVYPEPSPDLDTNVNINATIKSTLDAISLSFITRLQVIGRTIHIWYEDNIGKHLLSVGASSSEEIKRSTVSGASGVNAVDTLMVNGGSFVKMASSGYTFICDDGTALCKVAGLFATGGSTINTNDKISMRRDTNTDGRYDGSGEYNYGRILQHTQYGGGQVGVSNKGHLLYFTGIGTPSASVREVTVRGLCGVLAAGDTRQQIRFTHISRPHPTKSIVALVGAVTYSDVTVSGLQTFNEVFLLTTSRRTANVPDICAAVASDKEFERHTLASPVPFDLIRLTALAPRDR